jgi:UDP-glucose 4-epimerase
MANKRKILITGADGFIGSNLCNALRARNFGVKAVTRLPLTRLKVDENQLLDLLDDKFPEHLCDGVDTVIHLAGKAHALAETSQDAVEYFQINTEGSRKLLEAAKASGVSRFIYFSSVKAVGSSESQPMDESVVTPADTPYGQSKYAAEQLVLHGDFIPHPVVIRPSMVYGNTEKGNLPRMIKAIRRGIFPHLPEFGNKRSMVHVDDVVQATILAADNPLAAGQKYILTDGQAYSTRQLYELIRTALGKPPISWEIPLALLKAGAQLGNILGRFLGRRFPFDSDALDKLAGSAWYTSVKIERELGFKPSHTLETSVPEIVRYLSEK